MNTFNELRAFNIVEARIGWPGMFPITVAA